MAISKACAILMASGCAIIVVLKTILLTYPNFLTLANAN
jgi:hypothetical protein